MRKHLVLSVDSCKAKVPDVQEPAGLGVPAQLSASRQSLLLAQGGAWGTRKPRCRPRSGFRTCSLTIHGSVSKNNTTFIGSWGFWVPQQMIRTYKITLQTPPGQLSPAPSNCAGPTPPSTARVSLPPTPPYPLLHRQLLPGSPTAHCGVRARTPCQAVEGHIFLRQSNFAA